MNILSIRNLELSVVLLLSRKGEHIDRDIHNDKETSKFEGWKT
jgi:hypothetical protein